MSGVRNRVTIRTRLTLTYGGLFGMAAVAMIGLLYVFMKYVPVYDETLTHEGCGTTIQTPAASETPGCRPNATAARPEAEDQAAEASSPPGESTPSPDSEPMAESAAPVPSGDVGPPMSKTGFKVATKADVLNTLLIFSAISLMVLLMIALLLGWFVAGRMLAPLQRITATTRGIAGSTLHERITLTGPKDEIRELAETFNAMLQRLDQSFQAQRRFAANASHELRTPLASMRTVLQVAMSAPTKHRLEDVGSKLLTLNQRTTEITDALLSLARADHGAVEVEAVEVHALAEEVCVQARAQAQSAGVSLTVQADRGRVRGDPVLIRQLVTNLVDNGIRHNDAAGWMEVKVGERPDGDVRLTVRNSGRKLSQAEVDRAFEPFHRLDTRQADRRNRSAGHGLGLAIVRSIVRAHHGLLEAAPLLEGGIQVTVTLPASGDSRCQ